MPLHIETPLIQSRHLSLITNKTVWLKLEALQAAGSFKIRGVGFACEEYVRQGKTRFVCSSGGNTALAAAYAARVLGIPVTVVIPETTPELARTLMEEEGATVIVHGASWLQAHELALSMLDDSAAFVHPFDNPLMWRGHASLIDEVVRANVSFDAVILSVGGGGLLSGVIEGLERHGLGKIPVIAIETAGADSFAQALKAGHPITLPTITSVATSLGANMVAENAYRIAQTHDIRSTVVSDLEALDACESFLHDHRLVVEPACGAALTAIYSPKRRELLTSISSPLIIVCGGATVPLEKIREWRRAAAERNAITETVAKGQRQPAA